MIVTPNAFLIRFTVASGTRPKATARSAVNARLKAVRGEENHIAGRSLVVMR